MTLVGLYAIGILIGGGAILLLTGRWLRPRWSAWTALGVLLAAVLTFFLLPPRGPFEISLALWIPDAGWAVPFAYRFDTLGQAFALAALLAAGLLLAWLGSGAPKEERRDAPWVLLLLGAFLHLLLCADLLLAYAAWEGLVLTTYLMLAHRRVELPTAGIAEWFLGSHHVAGYALLFLLVLIAGAFGTLRYAQIDPGAIAPAFLLLLLGTAWVRTAQVPFQLWATAAAESPNLASTLLLGGWSLMATPYLWLRLLPRATDLTAGAGPTVSGEIAMIAGSASLVIGAILALGQESGRRVLAGDTTSRWGLLWIALGLGNAPAVAATWLLLLSFLLSRVTFHLAFSPQGWLGHRSRRLLFALGMWETAGLPCSLGFVGRWLLALGLLEAGRPAYLAAILVALPLTLAYLWRAWTLIPPDSDDTSPGSIPLQAIVAGPALLLPLGGLIVPWLWERLLERASMAVLGTAVIALRPFMETLPDRLFPGVLLLLLFVAGGGLWSGRIGIIRALRRPRITTEPADRAAARLLQQSLPALPQEIAWIAWVGQPVPIYRFFGHLLGWAGGRMQRLVTFLERHTTYFLLVTLILAGIILLVFTR